MMGMPDELLGMLFMSIDVKRQTGKDSYGNPTYSATETIDGYLENVTRVVGSNGVRDGVEGVTVRYSVPLLVIDGDETPPDAGDQITTTDDFAAVYIVERRSLFYDGETGEPHHYEIELSVKE